MNFQELGQALQSGREAKGLTIEAVMEATKISRVNLVAIENGDSESLPHPVYTKGFVKSYARLLGLDADELCMVVDQEYQFEEPKVEEVGYDVSPNAEKAFHDMDAPIIKKRSVWPSIFIVVVLIASIIAVVLYLNTGDKVSQTVQTTDSVEVVEPTRAPEPVEQAVETEDIVESESVVSEKSDEEEATQSDTVAAEVPVTESVPESTPATPVPEVTKPAAIPAAPTPSDPIGKEIVATQEAAPGQTKYAHVMIITATSDKGCWIGVWKGNNAKMSRDFVLKKGEPLRLMFNYPRRIRIGNVAGVKVLYNGKPYQLDKNKSNIQTLFVGMD